MSKANNNPPEAKPKILSPRDEKRKKEIEAMCAEHLERELETTLVKDLKILVDRLSRQDFS